MPIQNNTRIQLGSFVVGFIGRKELTMLCYEVNPRNKNSCNNQTNKQTVSAIKQRRLRNGKSQ